MQGLWSAAAPANTAPASLQAVCKILKEYYGVAGLMLLIINFPFPDKPLTVVETQFAWGYSVLPTGFLIIHRLDDYENSCAINANIIMECHFVILHIGKKRELEGQ